MSRLLATLAVFAVGMLLSVVPLLVAEPPPARPDCWRPGASPRATFRWRLNHGAAARSPESPGPSTRWSLRLREQKALEERLHFAERSTALGRLASAMAHEIRNPLNFINLSIDHLASRLGPEDVAEARRVRPHSPERQGRDQPPQPSGEQLPFVWSPHAPRPTPVSASRASSARWRPSSSPRPAIRPSSSIVEAEADLPVATADPELLKTCVLNLFINALDAMPGRRTAPGAGEPGARTQTGAPWLSVVVDDSGQGMDAEAIRGAFEPYFSTKEAGLWSRPRPDEEDRRRPRRHHHARERARPRHHGPPDDPCDPNETSPEPVVAS